VSIRLEISVDHRIREWETRSKDPKPAVVAVNESDELSAVRILYGA
jgi:hypothetical protein